MNKYIKEVERYYSKDYKKYHTIHHINKMMDLYLYYKLEFKKEFTDYNEDNLFETIAWHDVICFPGEEDNEKITAYFYHMKHENMKQEVFDAILSTGNKLFVFEHDIEKIIHDLDWSSFRYYEMMIEDEEKVFYEYTCNGIYTQKQVKEGRVEFLKGLLEQDIYVTNAFKGFNEQAKNNIKRRIGELEK